MNDAAKRAEDKLRDDVARLEMRLCKLKLKQARLYGQAHLDRQGHRIEQGDLCLVDGDLSFSPFKGRVVVFVRTVGDGRFAVERSGEIRLIASSSLRKLSRPEVANYLDSHEEVVQSD